MLVQSELIGILNDLLGQKARLRKGGVQLTYHCPFCADKNLITQKLEISISGSKIGYYHCWRCNTKGRTFGSLLKKLKAPRQFRDEIFKLTGDIRIARSNKTYEENEFLQLPEEFIPLYSAENSIEYRNAFAYLLRRGILREDILRYNIGYCEKGAYEHHIIIPSYDAKGELNFFIGRRYYETPGVLPYKKPNVPMDIIGFESFINYNEPINICEGVFDAIAIRNNAVPLFGKFPSKKFQETMILNKTKRVNMILDNDALKDAINNCKKMMRLGIDVHLVRLSDKDPSVLGFEKIHKLIRESPEFTQSDLLRYALKM